MEIHHIQASGMQPWQQGEGMPQQGFLWIDCVRGEDTDWPQLLQQLDGTAIHERHQHDSLNEAHASFFDFTSDYDMIIFRGITTEEAAAGVVTHPTAFFITDRCLVTVKPGHYHAIETVRERLQARPLRMPAGPDALLHLILNNMVDQMLLLRESLTERLQRYTETLLGTRVGSDDWRPLLEHRSELHRLEVLSEEQESAILTWRDNDPEAIDEHLRVRYTDLLEHIRRMTKFTQQQQHELDSLMQLHFSAVSHRTNAIVRTLTLLSAIFMPLTLITGIYGMNFEQMPELHSPYGYFLTLGAMGLLAALLLVLFRIKRWW
jgi:magnesium transporter